MCPGEPRKNIIEDMWLGVTIASQRQPSGRVLVSVARWGYLEGLWWGSLSIAPRTQFTIARALHSIYTSAKQIQNEREGSMA